MKNKDYINLVEFWNQSFQLSEEDKKEFDQINEDDDYSQLAPSPKLYDVLTKFNGLENVLDYGCGTGWASIILAKSNVKHITAVDVASNSIEMTNCYAKAFKVSDLITSFPIDENWIKNEKEDTYGGFYSSNVIDVIPLEMAEEIIKESARIVKKNAHVVFSLNYYIDPKEMEKRGCVVSDKSIYINGVLRLTALTDEEWKAIFEKYYGVVSLSYFSWPGENKETRRIFILKPLK